MKLRVECERGRDVSLAMKVEIKGEVLAIGEIEQLGAENCQAFRDQVYSAWSDDLKQVEVDLSCTTFLDSCGLGALISLYKTAALRNGKVRVVNPSPRVQRLLDVTRMHRVFEIVRS
jgi:anti-sigma B factor antagonist